MSLGGQPLPPHWEEAFDQKSGRSYFIDHVKKRTTWMDPRKWFDPNLPKTFSECKNGELPLGWEEVLDQRYGKLFINHLDRQVQVEDPRTQYLGQKEQMIANFISIVKSNSSSKRNHHHKKGHNQKHARTNHKRNDQPTTPTNQQPVDEHDPHHQSNYAIVQSPIDDMELLQIEIDRSKQRVDRLRREVNMNNGITDWKKERDHVKVLIARTDERIAKLVNDLRGTEPRTQALLDVAEKERALVEAAILHAKPSTDPAKALEQERKCELLKAEFQRAKQINNENIKTEIKRAENRDEIMKQIQQENESRRRLAMILDSMNQPRRPPARSQTFSDAPHYEERFERVPPKVISLIDLSSEERNEHNPPTNRLIEQVPRRIEESQNSVNSHGSSHHHLYR